jgi:hypothetical protein
VTVLLTESELMREGKGAVGDVGQQVEQFGAFWRPTRPLLAVCPAEQTIKHKESYSLQRPVLETEQEFGGKSQFHLAKRELESQYLSRYIFHC